MEPFRRVYTVGVRREISPHLYSYLHTMESDAVIIVLLSQHFISALISLPPPACAAPLPDTETVRRFS